MPRDFTYPGVNGTHRCISNRVQLLAGSRLDRACDELSAVANALGQTMTALFNGTTITAHVGETGLQAYVRYKADCKAAQESNKC